MDKRAIGVFDSGLGGLTAVKELRRVLPNESILYFGDTGRVPYGTRSSDTILKYARQDMRFLLSNNVKAIVAACGTVSSAAKEALEELDVPHIDVISPTAQAAAVATKNGRVGVIATSATIKSGAFQKKLTELRDTLTVFPIACPLLVPLVENGFIAPEEPITRLVLERYLTPLIANHVDTLIMGCTHYPIIEKTIAAVMGENVTLIDSGRETAHCCAAVLQENHLLCQGGQPPRHRFFVSDGVEGFHDIAEIFLGSDIGGEVKRIDIEKY
ncbi:MAG: glutamate racemase [Oscillospiraceae bacterium]